MTRQTKWSLLPEASRENDSELTIARFYASYEATFFTIRLSWANEKVLWLGPGGTHAYRPFCNKVTMRDLVAVAQGLEMALQRIDKSILKSRRLVLDWSGIDQSRLLDTPVVIQERKAFGAKAPETRTVTLRQVLAPFQMELAA